MSSASHANGNDGAVCYKGGGSSAFLRKSRGSCVFLSGHKNKGKIHREDGLFCTGIIPAVWYF